MKNCVMYRNHAHWTLCGGTKKKPKSNWMENAEILQKSRESWKKLCESFRDCVFFCECVSKMENVCECFFLTPVICPCFVCTKFHLLLKHFCCVCFLVCATENSSNCSNHESNGSIDHKKTHNAWKWLHALKRVDVVHCSIHSMFQPWS